MMIKRWIEAMRLRTLPVSAAGVTLAVAYTLMAQCFNVWPSIICLIFALLAQIASNFANEYYDYKNGLDRPGREGPRRGVTEGDITPQAMKTATYLTLGIACAFGLSLVYWGGWWLILAGIVIILAALAYSTGPYPLSRHALGEVAVIFFFGIIPVNLTFYIQSGYFDVAVLCGSLSVGLMGANILLVNNYRDMEDDAAVSKITLAVKFGRRFASTLYLFNGYIAVAFMIPVWYTFIIYGHSTWIIVPVLYLFIHTILWYKITTTTGHRLNPFLGMTAMLMFVYSLGFLLACIRL